MKLKNIVGIVYGFWILDYLSTFVALNFFGASEGNYLPALFYAHWWGWIIFPIIAFSILFIFSTTVYIIQNLSRRFLLNNNETDISFLISLLFILLWAILETLTTLHNIFLMFILK